MSELSQDKVLEMAKMGVLFGHRRSKTHPRMKQYIAHNKNELDLLSPEAVIEKLAAASSFLASVVKGGGSVLCVATTAPARDVVAQFASRQGWPFITSRWLGGTLTNFNNIRQRIDHYISLKNRREQGDFLKYTKKEQLDFDKQIGKMSQSFETLISLTKLPQALFIVDPLAHETGILEARKLSIPIIAIMDTNDNEDLIDYPVFGNDHNKTSIEWLVTELQKSF